MDLTQLKSELAKRLPLKRYEHVLRVMETAQDSSRKASYATVEKAVNSSLFHDIAKYMDKESLLIDY